MSAVAARYPPSFSPLAKPGFVSAIAHDHYSLLRTIQASWNLPCLAISCTSNDLGEFFP